MSYQVSHMTFECYYSLTDSQKSGLGVPFVTMLWDMGQTTLTLLDPMGLLDHLYSPGPLRPSRPRSRTKSDTLSFSIGMVCRGALLLWTIASVSSSLCWSLSTIAVHWQWSTPGLLCGEGPIVWEICTTAMVSRLVYGTEDSAVAVEYVILRSHQDSPGHYELTSSSHIP